MIFQVPSYSCRQEVHFTEYSKYELYIVMQSNGSSDPLLFNFAQTDFAADTNIRKYMSFLNQVLDSKWYLLSMNIANNEVSSNL